MLIVASIWIKDITLLKKKVLPTYLYYFFFKNFSRNTGTFFLAKAFSRNELMEKVGNHLLKINTGNGLFNKLSEESSYDEIKVF